MPELIAGGTQQSVLIDILDSTSTTGAGKTGLVFNTGSLIAYYNRPGAAPVAITLATQTVTGAWTSGGFVEQDATHCPGSYRLDLPDAACADGVTEVAVYMSGAANMAQTRRSYPLVRKRYGIVASGIASAGANTTIDLGSQIGFDCSGYSLFLTSGTGSGQFIEVGTYANAGGADNKGRVTRRSADGNWITNPDSTTGWIMFAGLKSGPVDSGGFPEVRQVDSTGTVVPDSSLSALANLDVKVSSRFR